MSLEEAFNKYATNGEIDGKTFVKMFKDSKLVDASISTTTLDLEFTKLKKRARKINFTQFLQGVEDIAGKKGVDVGEISESLAALNGPIFTGTKALDTRFHDDKDSYTGVHAHGGPSTKDKSGLTLSELTNRDASDIRGVPIAVSKNPKAKPT